MRDSLGGAGPNVRLAVLMREALAGLLLIVVTFGCSSSTGPAGFSVHAEVLNKTGIPNYWTNSRFTWSYDNAQHRVITGGYVTIQSDSQCITPPAAPPTTTYGSFDVQGYTTIFVSGQPDWTITVDSARGINWSPGLAYPCQ